MDAATVSSVLDALPPQFTRKRFTPGLVRNNYSLYNDDYFIKVQGPGAGTGNLRHELTVAEALLVAGVEDITIPASKEVYSTPLGDATIWFYIPGTTPAPEEWSVSRILQAVDGLADIHESGVKVDRTLDQTLVTVAHRKSLPTWVQMDSILATDIEHLLDKFVRKFEIAPADLVLTHGDAHIGNTIFLQRGMLWCDFESARMAPREWDIASMRHNVLRIGGRKDVWDEFLMHLVVDLDFDLVDQLETMKAVATTTYLIANGEYVLARKRVDALLPMLDGAPLPESLVAHPGR